MNWISLLAQTANDTGGDKTPPTRDAMYYIETYGIDALKVIVIILVAIVLSGIVAKMITKACMKSKVDETLAKFFGKCGKYAVMIFAVIMVLSVFGIETTSFAAVLGASALAIGLAFQGALGNLAAGVMLLFFRPFKVGDVVTVAGVTAKVNEIDLFSTVMDTFDNQRIIVPNGSVFGSTITNINFHDTRRVDVSVGTDYPADLDQAREVLMKAATSIEGVLEDPAPAVVLLDLGDSSINWVVRVWVNTPDFWAVKDALTREVKIQLDQAGIGIPFPQMDVHLDGKLGD
jgi:small conductance mechanosensitive channel